jgi:hypothetical protein
MDILAACDRASTLLDRDPHHREMVSGCTLGCGIQLACLATLFLAGMAGLTGAGALLIYWGVVQWIFLLPLIVFYLRNGRSARVKGMVIAGFLGILLNSGCALMLRNGISG